MAKYEKLPGRGERVVRGLIDFRETNYWKRFELQAPEEVYPYYNPPLTDADDPFFTAQIEGAVKKPEPVPARPFFSKWLAKKPGCGR